MQSQERTLVEVPQPGAHSDPGLREAIDVSLDELPATERAVILLCDVEGWKHREAAGILGLPVSTVSNRLARGRAALRKKLIRRGVVPSFAGVFAGMNLLAPREAVSGELVATVLAASKLVSDGGLVATAGLPSRIVGLCRRALLSLSASEASLVGVVLIGLAFAASAFPRLPAHVGDQDAPTSRVIVMTGSSVSSNGGLPIRLPPPALRRFDHSSLSIRRASVQAAPSQPSFLFWGQRTPRSLQSSPAPKLLGP